MTNTVSAVWYANYTTTAMKPHRAAGPDHAYIGPGVFLLNCRA